MLAAPARSGLSLLLSPSPPTSDTLLHADRTIVRKESSYRYLTAGGLTADLAGAGGSRYLISDYSVELKISRA